MACEDNKDLCFPSTCIMRTSCSQSEIKHVSLANKVVVKKLELLSAAPRATLTLLSCSPNFPRASITQYTHAKHEPILNYTMIYKNGERMRDFLFLFLFVFYCSLAFYILGVFIIKQIFHPRLLNRKVIG